MRRNGWNWQFGRVSSASVVSALVLVLSLDIALSKNSTLAQIVPDRTLGKESSVVNRIDALNERIDGGATRGENLFHSFQEFNVGEGRGVYFANPEGITNILSRVTGGNPSHILGRLGVLGGANLFLLNPNGILFGANSSLDISGSFVATTADGIQLGENGFFSATEPQKSRLLSVSPGVLFFEQAANTPGVIVNRGSLAVGKDLTFSADNLDLQGQLVAGGDLTLRALNTVQIRDSAINPFVAAAKGDLLVQGNQKVDIFALNHPASGLFSGKDLVLRSANTVGGDAHFWSGGNFRVERLERNLGNLYSPHDPVIRSLGDVSFDSYIGTSLHILAAGKVEIPGFIRITGADPVNGLAETVTLSDGTTVLINGKSEPTLDIRAGINPKVVGSFSFNPTDYFPFNSNFIFNPNIDNPPDLSTSPTNANINVGTIIFSDVSGKDGKVLLTNQYQPNLELNGNIEISSTLNGVAISTSGVDSGGLVAIDSRGNIKVNGSIIASSFPLGFLPSSLPIFQGNGGNVTLLANNNINFASQFAIFSNGLIGGNITLKSQGVIAFNSGKIDNSSYTSVPGSKGGDIDITAGSLSLINGAGLISRTFGQGNGGNINIMTGSLNVTNRARLDSSTFGKGDAGNITIQADEAVVFTEIATVFSNVESGAEGNGGDIDIKAGSLSILNGSQLQTIVDDNDGIDTLSPGKGKAGNINIDVRDTINISGQSNGFFSRLASTIQSETTGHAGSITLKADSISLTGGADLSTSTSGQGDAGDVFIQANNLVVLAENSFIFSTVEAGGIGNAGNVDIQAGSLTLTKGSQIQTLINKAKETQPAGKGNAGKINIDVGGTVTVTGVGIDPSAIISRVNAGASGNGGEIDIKARSLSVTDGGQLNSTTIGVGQSNAGNITIDASDTISFDGRGSNGSPSGIGSLVGSKVIGNGGNVEITTGSLSIANGALIGTAILGKGNAGNISIRANETVSIDGVDFAGFSSGLNSTLQQGAQGKGGEIEIVTGSLSVTNGASINTSTFGDGDAGNVFVQATDSISVNSGAQLRTDTFGQGNAGNVTINALNATVSFDGQFFNGQSLLPSGIVTIVQRGSTGDGGNITVKARSLFITNGAQLSSLTAGKGKAGNVFIDTGNLISLDNQALIVSSVARTAVGDGGKVEIKADSLSLNNRSEILTGTAGEGKAGDVSVQVDDAISLANRSGILSSVETGGEGIGGDIDIQSQSLSLTDGSQVQTILFRTQNGFPGGKGSAGNIEVNVTDFVNLSGVSPDGFSSGLFASTERGASGSAGTITITTGDFRVADGAVVNTLTANEGNANNITINANTFEATGGGQVVTTTRSSGQAGNITLNIADKTTLSGSDPNFSNRLAQFGEDVVNNQGAESGLYANTAPNSTGIGGNIILNTGSLNLSDRAQISALSQGQSNAGTITINANGAIDLTNSDITTSAEQASGGAINLTAQDIRLHGDSDIRTNVNVGAGGGGDITLTADSIIAYDDSDILAFARDGRGGNITLATPVFFGSQFQSAPEGTDPDNLDGNNRVDINASGAVGGVISLPDLTFIQNNLTELPANVINTEDLIANSCVVPNRQQAGTFIITGSGGLPVRPGDVSISPYPTGDVRTVPNDESSRPWTIGDPIVEPQGVYRLPNGQLVMSRECSQ
jgi:filamentous hemagglutinin family protein